MTKVLAGFNRRKFIGSLALIGAAGMTPVRVNAVEVLASPENPEILKCGPYLQAAFGDEITIHWITNSRCHSWVKYGSDASNLNLEAKTLEDGLFEANNTVHAITITGLEPGKVYYYKLFSKNIDNFHPYKIRFGETFESKVFSFQSPDDKKDSLDFLIFNDIHDRPESFATLAQFRDNSQKDFIFLNGDMFNWQIDEDQLVKNLLTPLCEHYTAAQTPFIFSRGNHETRGVFARDLKNYFDGRENQYFYSFEKGPAYFIVLDSGEDKANDHIEYGGLVDFDEYRLRQRDWLANEIQKKEFKRAKYRIVFSHIPLYYAGSGHGTMHCRELWGSLLNQGKIDLLVSGHTHRHGLHPAVEGQHNYPIVIGGGKSDGSRTITNVRVDRQSLDLQMTDDSGKVVHKLSI